MKVTIGATVVCDGADRTNGIAFGFKVNGSGLAQVEAFLRADSVSVFARGNRSNVVSFSVSTVHANEGVAMAHAMAHADSFAAVEQVVFELTAPGVSGGTFHFTAALVQVASEYIGATTISTYTLTGGKLISGAP